MLNDVKDLFNILFFLVMSAVAILSYLQARKTLFSPIKTEIFKIQISEFQGVLEFFNKQTSNDFDIDFDIRNIFEINSFKMHEAYVENFFKNQLIPSEEWLRDLEGMVYGAVVSQKHLVEIKAGMSSPDKEENQELSPEMKIIKWNEFELHGVSYTKKYYEKINELSKIAASPLLPKEVTNYIYEFKSLMHRNLMCMGRVINECAQELPKSYKTIEENKKFNPAWMWNKYNRERESTDKIASDILLFINNYLKINEIMK